MRPDENNRTYAPGGSEEEKLLKNMGLVHSIASRFPYSGVEYEDLVQIGSLGLLKAIRNFDESKGFAFSTYAVPQMQDSRRPISLLLTFLPRVISFLPIPTTSITTQDITATHFNTAEFQWKK